MPRRSRSASRTGVRERPIEGVILPIIAGKKSPPDGAVAVRRRVGAGIYSPSSSSRKPILTVTCQSAT
jgi:hypothetical protein